MSHYLKDLILDLNDEVCLKLIKNLNKLPENVYKIETQNKKLEKIIEYIILKKDEIKYNLE